jgi:two-component system alkaline phosphatase synthesis response regulator PhoP
MVRIISEPVPNAPARKPRAKARILVIDDNAELASIVSGHLQTEGYEVLCAKDGEAGLALARKRRPQLILLDLQMPKMDGLSFLKALRQESQVPVLVLSSKHSDLNQVLGFKLGADDCMGKPFAAEVLTARVEAILKRAAVPAKADDKSILRLGKMTVDPERREVQVEGRVVGLTIKEFDLLKALIDARGKVLSRDHLLSTVWAVGPDVEIRTRTVDQHIAGIRQKLGPEGERVMTVPHFGYRIKLD